MTSLSSWRIFSRNRESPTIDRVAEQFITFAARLEHDSLPAEVSLLLPNQDGARALIKAIHAAEIPAQDALGLGLFLADPFFIVDHQIDALKAAGISWITNLPSVAQHDDSFAQQLSEVQFNLTRELDRLAEFKAAGFRIAVTVTDATGATAACALDPDMLIVLPHVGDFSAGFPSFRHRGVSADAVSQAAKKSGWEGPIYGLGTTLEAESVRLWPDVLDGLICRPQRL
ncbi:MAG: hypothetical protein P1V34_09995 [Alphaproteobacteria bacterium]|nr:hypothetical protein [Alphaproteobacteria bacterium]